MSEPNFNFIPFGRDFPKDSDFTRNEFSSIVVDEIEISVWPSSTATGHSNVEVTIFAQAAHVASTALAPLLEANCVLHEHPDDILEEIKSLEKLRDTINVLITKNVVKMHTVLRNVIRTRKRYASKDQIEAL